MKKLWCRLSSLLGSSTYFSGSRSPYLWMVPQTSLNTAVLTVSRTPTALWGCRWDATPFSLPSGRTLWLRRAQGLYRQYVVMWGPEWSCLGAEP